MSVKHSYQDYLNNKAIKRNDDLLSPIDVNKKEHPMDEIIPNVYLGNYVAAYEKDLLDKHNINYIINITDSIECPFNDKKYLYIPIRDKWLADIKYYQYTISFIIKAIHFINKALANNSAILVHCKKGHHRSANLILFYLISKYPKLSFEEAENYIRSKRPTALTRETNLNKIGKSIGLYLRLLNDSKK